MGFKDAILRPKSFVYLGIFILLLFMPSLLPIYQLMLFESGLTFAIMCLGFNLLLRYTGLLSFGHGALFATGAYAVGMMGRYLPELYHLVQPYPLPHPQYGPVPLCQVPQELKNPDNTTRPHYPGQAETPEPATQ